MKSAAFFWLVLLVVFLIAEAACPIHLVSIWFALGALVALLCAALGAPVWLQITLFVVVSGVLLALLWPLAKKFLNSKVTATNVDSVVGSIGRVTADIDNVEARGQVKLGGMEWTAQKHLRRPHQHGNRSPGGQSGRREGLCGPCRGCRHRLKSLRRESIITWRFYYGFCDFSNHRDRVHCRHYQTFLLSSSPGLTSLSVWARSTACGAWVCTSRSPSLTALPAGSA